MQSSQLVFTQDFSYNIRIMCANTHKKLVNDCSYLKKSLVLVCFLLESMDIGIFSANLTPNNEICLEKTIDLPPPGFEIEHLSFTNEAKFSAFSKKLIMFTKDFSIVLLDFQKLKKKDCSHLELLYRKPIFSNYHPNISFRLVNSHANSLLFKDSYNNFYVSEDANLEKNLIKLKGKFHDGLIINDGLEINGIEGRSMCMLAFSRGTIDVYGVFPKNLNYNVIKLNSINAHYGNITFGHVSGRVEILKFFY
jgi:hypothetical protein